MCAAELRRDRVRRFGLIALATDVTIEGDAARLMPPGTQLHVTRIAFENPTTPATLLRTGERLQEAAELILPGVALEGILFGCTSASAVLGRAVGDLVGRRAPVTTPLGGALRACEALGVNRVALLAPYMEDITERVADYFRQHGIEVVATRSMGHADDRDMGMLSREAVNAAALAADHPRAEALFLSCTALPAVPLIDRLEQMVAKPVLSANQVAFWSMLDTAGITGPGPGRLFELRRW